MPVLAYSLCIPPDFDTTEVKPPETVNVFYRDFLCVKIWERPANGVILHIMKIKETLIEKLKAEHCLWSYDQSSITDMPDTILIEKVMVYLDLDDINQLFTLYGYKKVKKVWLEYLVPQGDYLYLLNRFFAWYYFKAKNPDAYIKSMATRHLNKLLRL